MFRTKTINRQNGFEAYYLIATKIISFNNHVINMNSFEFPTNTSTLISSLGFNIIRHNNSEVAVVSIPDNWDGVVSINDSVGCDFNRGYTRFRGPNNINLLSFVDYRDNHQINFLQVHIPEELMGNMALVSDTLIDGTDSRGKLIELGCKVLSQKPEPSANNYNFPTGYLIEIPETWKKSNDSGYLIISNDETEIHYGKLSWEVNGGKKLRIVTK